MPLLPGDDAQAVADAAARLAAGELVAFATETVYGLGARADDDAAVRAIYAAKGRPAAHPLIVHVPDRAAAAAFTEGFDARAQRLAGAFWPGPLTLILPRRDGVAEVAAGGQRTIGLRCPAHPVAQALLQAAAARGVPGVAAPSANRFGRISPTLARHVAEEFGDALAVLDGGACAVGIESAIVDLSRERAALLRPGALPRAQLEAALGEPLAAADAASPRAPGTLASHYAPRATLRLMSAEQLKAALEVLPTAVDGLAVYWRTVPVRWRGAMQQRMPDDAAAAAHDLFAVLRGFDERAARLIWVERPPAAPEWDGVRDRLQRAAAG